MDDTACIDALSDLALDGWRLRDAMIAAGPLSPEVVALEDAVHGLEFSLATLVTALSNRPDHP